MVKHLILTAAGAVVLTGCSLRENPDATTTDTDPRVYGSTTPLGSSMKVEAKTIIHDGHKYIVFMIDGNVEIKHHPNCRKTHDLIGGI